MKQPKPTTQWRRFLGAQCTKCNTWWQGALVRWLDGVWFIKCPLCDEQKAR